MHVVSFTTLFPNNIWPTHGVFVQERLLRVARLPAYDLQVVAPVPFWPAFLKCGSRWPYSQVVRREVREGLMVDHPRYGMIPKIGMVLHGWLLFLSVLPFMRRLLRQRPVDVLDVHYVYPEGFAGILLGAYFGLPVVVSARGSDINQFGQFQLIRPFLSWTLRRAHRVIAVSEALKNRIVALNVPADHISTIPNGVDPKKFFPVERSLARRHLDLPEKRVVLSVGGLVSHKGFDLLIKAFDRLVQEGIGDDLLLIIVGEGPIRSDLEQLVDSLGLSSQVILPGAIAHEDLRWWFGAAEVFCLASSREGWPNVVMEALACGRPVVASSVGGIPEILSSSDLGVLSNRSVGEFAHALSSALSRSWNPAVFTAFAARYTWEHVAHSVDAVFSSAVSDCHVKDVVSPDTSVLRK